MAAFILPAPGTQYGPCTEDCHHRDCLETRLMATAECWYCRKSIGYGARFYRDAGEWVHAACAEDAADLASQADALSDGERTA